MLSGLFEEKPVYRKFLILVFIILLNTIIFSMVAGLLVNSLYGVDMLSDPDALSDLENPMVISAMKMLQILTTGIGMFLIPSIVAAILFSKDPLSFLSLDRIPAIATMGLTILLMLAMIPIINMMLIWNQDMQLPSFLSEVEAWMKNSEEQAQRITEVFLKMQTSQELLFNLFIVAILPAIGEELLFRGVIQNLFKEITKNIHVAIIITAILFSAIHMQFYGFFPRMFLGMLFGYLLVWSGSIWLPILAHLINNGMAVLFSYYSTRNELPFDQDTIGTTEGQWPLTIVSILLVALLLFLIKKISSNRIESQQ